MQLTQRLYVDNIAAEISIKHRRCEEWLSAVPLILPATKKKYMFKVGDKVRVKSTETNWGRQGTVGVITEEQDELNRWRVEFDTVDHSGDKYLLLTSEKPELLKGQKLRAVKFLLKYDLDEDPIEEFETIEQVNERIKELLQRSDLRKDSMVVYEIKAKKSVR